MYEVGYIYLMCTCTYNALHCTAGTYWMVQRTMIGLTPIYSGVLAAVSAAMAVFLVYNVIAGGNPPKGAMSH